MRLRMSPVGTTCQKRKRSCRVGPARRSVREYARRLHRGFRPNELIPASAARLGIVFTLKLRSILRLDGLARPCRNLPVVLELALRRIDVRVIGEDFLLGLEREFPGRRLLRFKRVPILDRMLVSGRT